MTMQPPPDLLAQVLHAIEGETVERQVLTLPDGTEKTVELRFFGPDKWISRVHERGILTPLQFLAIVHFVLLDFKNPDQNEQRIVDGWYRTLLDAAESRILVPRDPDSMLPLDKIDDWNSWVLSLADANALVASVGMEWTCTEVAAHLFNESSPSGWSKEFFEALGASATPKAGSTPVSDNNGRSKHASTKDKLTKQQREEIVRRAKDGETQAALGREYGVTPQAIGKVVRGAARAANNPFGVRKVLRS